MKAQNLTGTTGNPVASQIEITEGEDRVFQSYGKIIVKIGMKNGKRVVSLDANYWNYSCTTSKYRAQFLGETTKETAAKIKSGQYILEDFN